MLILLFMLLMLMMVKLEEVPFFFCADTAMARATVNDMANVECGMLQKSVSLARLSTAWRMLQNSASGTMLSSECLNAEPFTRDLQYLPCVQPSNVLFDEVLTEWSGDPWTE